MMMKLLVKREDDGRVARIEIEEEDNMIYDLLQESKTLLQFDQNAILCAYPEGESKVLSEATPLSDLKGIKLLIIKDKKQEAKTKAKEKELKRAKDEENLKNVTEQRQTIADKLKHEDNLNEESSAFAANLHQTTTSPSSSQHELLDSVKSESQRNGSADAESFSELLEGEEISILKKKLRVEGLRPGFLYDINADDLSDLNESIYVEHAFSSEEERKNAQSQVYNTSDWSSWHAECGFSGWGVSVSASAGQTNTSSQHKGSKTEETSKTCTAVVTRTSFHQMKKFGVKLRLDDAAVRDAKEILNAAMHEKREAITAFNSKYCSYVYSGQFSAGGWFRTVATARSTEAMEFSALSRAASDKTETHWEASASGYGISAGGGQRWGKSSNSESQQTNQSNHSTVDVRIRKESAPGNTSSETDLEIKIKSAKNWTVFPLTGAKKSSFSPIHEIMRNQALETNDKDLLKVSDLMKMYMKG